MHSLKLVTALEILSDVSYTYKHCVLNFLAYMIYRYDNELLVEYNIQCDEDQLAYPFIVDLDIQGPDCTDGDGNKK